VIGWIAGVWGLFGGFAVEGLDLRTAMRRYGCWPWQVRASSQDDGRPVEAGLWGYLVGELIRLVIGAGLAWAAAATGQITGPLGALAVGAAAPVIVGQLAAAAQAGTSQAAPQAQIVAVTTTSQPVPQEQVVALTATSQAVSQEQPGPNRSTGAQAESARGVTE
jgi:hypothetical protein